MVYYRPGSRFGPSDLGAVRRYLRRMVERKDSDCLSTMDVYADEPWLLDHVSNPLFEKNHWYYFVPRTKQSRIVKGRGESEGGTWKSTGRKVDIVDGNKKVWGYKRSLVFHKKLNRQPKPTNWLMTEFSLHKDGRELQDLVLVFIRYKKVKNGNNLLGNFYDAPRVDREHGEVPQVREEHVELENYANEIEGMLEREDVDFDEYVTELERTMIEEEDPQQNTSDLALLPPHSNYNKENINELERMMLGEEDLQQNTSDFALPPLAPQSNYYDDMMMLPPLPPSMVGQSFGFETMMTTTQSSGNNFLMATNDNDFTTQRWNQEEQHWLVDLGFEGVESVMLDVDQLLGEPIADEEEDHKV